MNRVVLFGDSAMGGEDRDRRALGGGALRPRDLIATGADLPNDQEVRAELVRRGDIEIENHRRNHE